MSQIIAELDRDTEEGKVPVIVFTKHGGQWLEKIAGSGCDAIGIDWMTNLADAKNRVGNKVALQGNLDHAALYAPTERIKQQVEKILKDFGKGTGHVFNLGHGILPNVDPDHVQVLIEAVHQYGINN